jgi:glycerol-3-phosphate dehydrogenase (NAD(P)+)
MSGIAILGAGSWGTALAVHLARQALPVRLWAREPAVADELQTARTNRAYLPGVAVPVGIEPYREIAAAVSGAEVVVVAVPSHGVRDVVRAARPALLPGAILVSAAKGLEVDSLQRMSQVIAEEVGGGAPIVVLSGPSFAAEVARGLPTVVLAASTERGAAAEIQERFRGPVFRIYESDDVAGVELGGALKNVIAIAAGVVEGLELGHNSLAALITRGLAEMSRLAAAAGGRRETLAGLSGLGDLVLTCTGDLSRNRRVGIELARGRSLSEILAGMRMVAEGVKTTGAALALGRRHDIELPIAAEMAAVLGGQRTPRAAVEALMGRPQRPEPEYQS